MITPNRTKERLLGGEQVLGSLTLMSDPWVVEIVGNAGLDFMIIDMEHTLRDLANVENLLRAAEATGLSPLVRVPELDRKLISRLMDAGAQGIVLPLVEDAETAQLLKEYVAYPPMGSRTTCSSVRAAHRGLLRPHFERYVEQTNLNALTIVLIETQKGVEQLPAILDVGIDVVLIGRTDLAADMGLFYGADDPSVLSVCDDIIAEVISRERTWAGMVAYERKEAARWLAKGCNFLIYSLPEFILASTYQAVVGELRPADPIETRAGES